MTSNYNLKELNTFGLSCIASQFVSIASKDTLIEFLTSYKKSDSSLLILGGGSNLLFTKDYDGIVLKNEIKGIKVIEENDKQLSVEVGAGEVWHDFVLHCVEKKWAGVENLSLIPGTVGASPIQNIGAYGVEVKDVIEKVHTVNISTLEEKTFLAEECEFGYRDSVFKRQLKDKLVIT